MSSVQQMLRENHQSLAIVIDEYSGTYGIITIEDMNREIFGQMNDEYSYGSKKKEINIEKKDNTCVSGQTRLCEINEQLHISLESQCCETLGGYMCEILGRIPLEKESIIREGYKFTVHALDDKRVSSVHIQKIKNEEEES
jgi:putative hemolysin